jgi:hypothetical protein
MRNTTSKPSAQSHIRKALCRDSEGRSLGPLGAALDIIAARGAP